LVLNKKKKKKKKKNRYKKKKKKNIKMLISKDFEESILTPITFSLKMLKKNIKNVLFYVLRVVRSMVVIISVTLDFSMKQ